MPHFICNDDCPWCLGTGLVCDAHPRRAWLLGSCCAASPRPCLGIRPSLLVKALSPG